jgi:hypothetical protein
MRIGFKADLNIKIKEEKNNLTPFIVVIQSKLAIRKAIITKNKFQ